MRRGADLGFRKLLGPAWNPTISPTLKIFCVLFGEGYWLKDVLQQKEREDGGPENREPSEER